MRAPSSPRESCHPRAKPKIKEQSKELIHPSGGHWWKTRLARLSQEQGKWNCQGPLSDFREAMCWRVL